MMAFPKKQDEADFSQLCVGPCDFRIAAIFDTDKETGEPIVTKKGYPKVQALCFVTDQYGNKNKLYVHLPCTYRTKIEEFVSAVGMPELCTDAGFDYKNPALIGASGKGILTQNDGYPIGMNDFIYPKQSTAAPMPTQQVKQQNAVDDDFSDEIPF